MVSGCWFHYAQAVIRLKKIGLSDAYNNEETTQVVFRCLLALYRCFRLLTSTQLSRTSRRWYRTTHRRRRCSWFSSCSILTTVMHSRPYLYDWELNWLFIIIIIDIPHWFLINIFLHDYRIDVMNCHTRVTTWLSQRIQHGAVNSAEQHVITRPLSYFVIGQNLGLCTFYFVILCTAYCFLFLKFITSRHRPTFVTQQQRYVAVLYIYVYDNVLLQCVKMTISDTKWFQSCWAQEIETTRSKHRRIHSCMWRTSLDRGN